MKDSENNFLLYFVPGETPAEDCLIGEKMDEVTPDVSKLSEKAF